MSVSKLGLIINPIAGMGGAVGLHGTDGAGADEARRRGAGKTAAIRARLALATLVPHRQRLQLLTASGGMGEVAAQDCGFRTRLVHSVPRRASTAEDTTKAAAAMRAAAVDLILFAGGDGTARDIFQAVGRAVPILGIPAGVKMHSAVFATNPRNAGRLAADFLFGDAARLSDAEIMDREQREAGGPPAGDRSPQLFGFARTPHLRLLRQAAKSSPPLDEDADLDAVCRDLAGLARDETVTIVGPGTTTRRVKRHIGYEGTLAGVDAYRQGEIVAADASESQLLSLAARHPLRLIVGIVGGQGFLFGRGNQPISAEIIRLAGRENVLVVASLSKLLALPEALLFMDTGSDAVDLMFQGFISVLIGRGRRTMIKVAAFHEQRL